MIAGLGVDLVHLPGFREQLGRPGTAFAEAVFTAAERREAAARPGEDALHLAGRYAAKEAFVKAWSGGRFGRAPALDRADLAEIEVVGDAWGRPALHLHGAVARAFPADHRLHLSLSHDGDHAVAVVVIEAPDGAPPSR